MKIIWNNPSSSNTTSDTVKQTEQTEQTDTSRIALPKPTGQWIQNPETIDVAEEATENPVSASKIHVPEATRQHLQRLSIQEINLYEEVQETECVKGFEATEVISIIASTSASLSTVATSELTDTLLKETTTPLQHPNGVQENKGNKENKENKENSEKGKN